MHAISFIQDLAVIMLVAGVVTILFHRLKQPVVLGYIVAGFIIGPHTPPFGLIHDEDTIKTLAELGLKGEAKDVPWCAVKEAVLPFNRFPGVDPILGPEMKSTGEVMGLDMCFELAYWKSQIAAGQKLPLKGNVFLSARDSDKPWIVEIGGKLAALGFGIPAILGAYCWVIWVTGFGPEDRVLFRRNVGG